MRLDNKTIVVTGASSGLGKAMAEAFVTEGAQVVYSSRSRDRLDEAIENISDDDPSGEAMAVPADVRSWDDVQQLVRRTTQVYGDIDVFVNNAGTLQSKVNPDRTHHVTQDVPITTWDTIIHTNLRGVFLCTKAVLPTMLSRDSGRVIHISSGHGIAGRAERSPYVASKFALEGLHESLALELQETDVETVTLRPPSGGVYTERSKLFGKTPEDYPHKSPDVIVEAAVRLAAGEGKSGGRYKATPDGEEYVTYTRSES
jgi:3-oxoacyl-[acyl-carrier protein] reductase